MKIKIEKIIGFFMLLAGIFTALSVIIAVVVPIMLAKKAVELIRELGLSPNELKEKINGLDTEKVVALMKRLNSDDVQSSAAALEAFVDEMQIQNINIETAKLKSSRIGIDRIKRNARKALEKEERIICGLPMFKKVMLNVLRVINFFA